jgi:hypothetical protein
MQRALVITFAASPNSATDRAFGSVMLANAEIGFNGITSAALSGMATAAKYTITRQTLIIVIGAPPSCRDSI